MPSATTAKIGFSAKLKRNCGAGGIGARWCAAFTYQSPDNRGRPGRWASRRLARTAPERNSPLGWAEIRHPFHPLRGQRFEVLKARRIAGIDTLLLRELGRGSFSIARKWTDWADPSLGLPTQRLDADSLFELAALLEQLTIRTIPKQKG